MFIAAKQLLSGILAVAVLVGACFFGYRGLRTLELKGEKPTASISDQTPGYEDDDGRPTVALQGQWYALRENVETMLLIGLDKYQRQTEQQGTFRNTQQSDFLLLLILDHTARTCTALHINRDTMAQIHMLGLTGEDVGTFTGQLALSHTYGSGGTDSGRNTALAVSELLYGTRIDHFVSFTMDAVSLLNDSVGGVPVEVLDDFSQADPSLKQGETVLLRGEQALVYVRARRSMEDNTNLARMERQRQYLSALYGRVVDYASGSRGALAELIVKVSPYMVADCSAQRLYELASKVSAYELGDILTLDGEAKLGKEFMEFYPDEQALTQLLIDLLYEPVNE